MKHLLWLFLLFPLICYGSDSKITDLTDVGASDDDVMYIVDNPGTTSASDNKITLGNLLLWLASEDWTVTGTWNWSGATTSGVNANTVVVVDSTDTTSYVAIVDSANGNLAVKTDTGLTYNAETGVLTATGFSGPLTGNVTGTSSLDLPLTGGTITGSVTNTKVNAAGGSADVLTLSGTLGIMDGSDTFRGLYLNYTNADHTGSINTVQAISIPTITGDAHATETGIYIGAGWDYAGYFLSPLLLGGDGSTTKGSLYFYDLDNSAYVKITPADETTSWIWTTPATSPTGVARFDAGVMSASDALSGVVVGGFTASKALASDGDGNATVLSTQDVITTGTIDGKILVTLSTAAAVTVSGSSGVYINGDNDVITFNLPAAANGLGYCFMNALYAQALTIHPASGDYIILAGENNDSSDVVSTGANTDKICVLGLDTTYWLVTASTGTWAND